MPEFSPTYVSSRLIHLQNFDDGGLSTGPRRIEIYLPDGYDQTDERYPVIYFNDGGNVFSRPGASMSVDTAYDGLIADGLIHPAIFVGIGLSSVPGRLKSMTPTSDRGGGGLGGYFRFISEVLKPCIDGNYRTKPEAASTGIAGYSLGGSSAFIMAYEHPETFGIAGCMSSALWSDQKYAIKLLTDGNKEKKPIQFWLDAGGSEYHMWLDAAHAYGLLEQHGWIPGDDLAAYFDYRAEHNFLAAAGRMRQMLHFFLRKDPYVLESYRLVCAVNPEDEKMDLGNGLRCIVGAEAWYTNGFRLTVPRPVITASGTNIAAVDAGDPILLRNVGPGNTTITSTYQGHTATLPVIGCDPNTSPAYFPCPSADATPGIDTDGINWPGETYSIVGGDEEVVARFNVWHDGQHVHIVVHVLNNSVFTEQGKQPWEQDGIEITFDARPLQDLLSRSSTVETALCIYMNPSIPSEQISMYYPEPGEWRHTLLPGMHASCAVVPGGFNAVLSIPAGYLDEKQSVPWKYFRLNIFANKYNPVFGVADRPSWQVGWVKFLARAGSGIFDRE